MFKPDIVAEIQKHTELKARGRYLWGICPLPGHLEKTASFKIDPQKQTFYCFGCNRGGDVISFIQHLKNLSFKDAIRYLRIDNSSYRLDSREIKKRELVRKFKRWGTEYFNDLTDLYRCLQIAKQKIKSIEDMDNVASFYHEETRWLYEIEVLLSNNDETKIQLYQERFLNDFF